MNLKVYAMVTPTRWEIKSNMQVVHLCTNDFGGAGSAALRVHQALLNIAVDSKLLVQQGVSDKREVYVVKRKRKISLRRIFSVVKRKLQFEDKYCMYSVANESGGKIVDEFHRFDLKPDVIVLHWVAGFISLENIKELYDKFQCKIYWYALDMAPFTGGCHYSWGCMGYLRDCASCPALKSRMPVDSPRKYFSAKKSIVENCKVSAIASNRWVYEQLKSSSVSFYDIDMCYLPFRSDIFIDKDTKDYSKGMPVRLLFGALNLRDARKGSMYFIEAMKRLHVLLDQAGGAVEAPVILLPGHSNDSIATKLPFQVESIDFARNEDELCKIYNVSDLFISSSVEDSGPMMVSESLLCGTPVVSFKMGIAPELIEDGHNGYLTDLKSSEGLAISVFKFLKLSSEEKLVMRANARSSVVGLMSEKVAISRMKEILLS